MKRLLRRLRRRWLVWSGGRWRDRFVRCHECAHLTELQSGLVRNRRAGYGPRVIAPVRARPPGFSERLDPCRHWQVCAGRWFRKCP